MAHERDKCVFCRIYDNKEATEILYKLLQQIIERYSQIKHAYDSSESLMTDYGLKNKGTVCSITENIKDNDFAVFCDIKPAAKHHYLVITREHIPNAKQLKSEEKSIVEKLIEIGKQVLATKDGDASDARFGFHWPPFNSISHLHLHVISPASGMGTTAKIIFRENSWWFVTPEYVLSRL